jgi:hypothetical protein
MDEPRKLKPIEASVGPVKDTRRVGRPKRIGVCVKDKVDSCHESKLNAVFKVRKEFVHNLYKCHEKTFPLKNMTELQNSNLVNTFEIYSKRVLDPFDTQFNISASQDKKSCVKYSSETGTLQAKTELGKLLINVPQFLIMAYWVNVYDNLKKKASVICFKTYFSHFQKNGPELCDFKNPVLKKEFKKWIPRCTNIFKRI